MGKLNWREGWSKLEWMLLLHVLRLSLEIEEYKELLSWNLKIEIWLEKSSFWYNWIFLSPFSLEFGPPKVNCNSWNLRNIFLDYPLPLPLFLQKCSWRKARSCFLPCQSLEMEVRTEWSLEVGFVRMMPKKKVWESWLKKDHPKTIDQPKQKKLKEF